MNDLIRKLAKDTLHIKAGGSGAIDETAMTVGAIICTPLIDRDGEIMEPSGAILDEHRQNPVVLFGHYKPFGDADAAGFGMPIGRAELDDGTYTVTYDKVNDWLYTVTRFSQKTAFAEAVFSLYAERILRAWSVGGITVKGSPMPGARPDRDGNIAMRHTSWRLLEYSALALGGNPDALTVKLQKGFGLKDPYKENILRGWLEPYTIPPKAWAKGWSGPEESIVDANSQAAEVAQEADSQSTIAATTEQVAIDFAAGAIAPADITKGLTAPHTIETKVGHREKALKEKALQLSDVYCDAIPEGAQHLARHLDNIESSLKRVERQPVVECLKNCGRLMMKTWQAEYNDLPMKVIDGIDMSDDPIAKSIGDHVTKAANLSDKLAASNSEVVRLLKKLDVLQSLRTKDAQAAVAVCQGTEKLLKSVYMATGYKIKV